MPDNTSELIRRLGYDFKQSELIELALSHRSVGSANNERLEFLGDSILNYIIGEALFKKFPQCREGELSRMRAQLVKGVTLAEIAREFNLGDYLRLGPGEMKSGGFRRESILADAVEALIGAIYLDGGMDASRERVLIWYHTRLQNIMPGSANRDAKSQLQEYLQSRQKSLPVYRLVATSGSDHQQEFEVDCEISHRALHFRGRGSNRRAAEQAAAQLALDEMQQPG